LATGTSDRRKIYELTLQEKLQFYNVARASTALLADPEFVVPIVRVDWGSSTLNFCSDDLESLVGVLDSTNRPANTSYPFLIACRNIGPGSTKTFTASLRFGPSASSVRDLSADILKRYADKYPFQVERSPSYRSDLSRQLWN